MEKRKNVPKILKCMNVGDVETFPITQAESVTTVYTSKLIEERLCGKRWTGSRNYEKKIFKVTRTK